MDLFAMVNAVPSRYEGNATWLANKQTYNTVKQMSTGSNGSYFWSDFTIGSAGKDLLGSPTVACSDMTAATTSGSKLILLGDFRQFLIYDRIGTSVESSRTSWTAAACHWPSAGSSPTSASVATSPTSTPSGS